jgi:5'-nucleotidase
MSGPSHPRARRRGRYWMPLVACALSAIVAGPAAAAPPSVSVHVLAFNDFHGAIDPPSGSAGLVNGTPAGGAEYLGTTVRSLRTNARAEGADAVLTVAAGDLIGSSPLLSGAFHDEPTIEIMNAIGLDASAVGDGELQEGVAELARIQAGGCHPVDGCLDGDGFAGASSTYLAANMLNSATGAPTLVPYTIRRVGNVKLGIVGITARSAANEVNPAGLQDVSFADEAATANAAASMLKHAFGVKNVVLLIHEGGAQNAPVPDPNGCANFAGPVASTVARLAPAYVAVVSGHTHRAYTCALPNSAGRPTLVTSAGSFGTQVTDIELVLEQGTGQVISTGARNVIVENGVRNPDGSWARDPAGNFIRNPALVDPAVKAIADRYRSAVAPIANRVVGTITADITRDSNAAGESSLGDVVADAQLAYTVAAGAQIALVDAGELRSSLVYAFSPGGEPAGQVTYGEVFTAQPFNELVVTQTYTGAQLKDVLEQQFAGFAGQTVTRILQVSAGFAYTYDTTRALGSRVSNLRLNGVPIDPAATYRVTMSGFLAGGGDGFSTLTAGTNRTTAPGFDIDALVAHLGSAPVAPGPQDRITKDG